MREVILANDPIFLPHTEQYLTLLTKLEIAAPTAPARTSPMPKVSSDVQAIIASFLDAQSLVQYANTCRTFRQVAAQKKIIAPIKTQLQSTYNQQKNQYDTRLKYFTHGVLMFPVCKQKVSFMSVRSPTLKEQMLLGVKLREFALTANLQSHKHYVIETEKMLIVRKQTLCEQLGQAIKKAIHLVPRIFLLCVLLNRCCKRL
jgi:hypothetical protein